MLRARGRQSTAMAEPASPSRVREDHLLPDRPGREWWRLLRLGARWSKVALIHSGIALVLAPPASWLGFPAVVAGGGIRLGIQALAGAHRRLRSWRSSLAYS
jgi:hypothetical protein